MASEVGSLIEEAHAVHERWMKDVQAVDYAFLRSTVGQKPEAFNDFLDALWERDYGDYDRPDSSGN